MVPSRSTHGIALITAAALIGRSGASLAEKDQVNLTFPFLSSATLPLIPRSFGAAAATHTPARRKLRARAPEGAERERNERDPSPWIEELLALTVCIFSSGGKRGCVIRQQAVQQRGACAVRSVVMSDVWQTAKGSNSVCPRFLCFHPPHFRPLVRTSALGRSHSRSAHTIDETFDMITGGLS